MTRAINEATVREHLAAENRHDMAATLATVHPDCVFVDEPLGRRFEGRAGAREYYDLWWSAFGNVVEAGEIHWPRDDLLIGDAAFAGRHVGRSPASRRRASPSGSRSWCSSTSATVCSAASASSTTSTASCASSTSPCSRP